MYFSSTLDFGHDVHYDLRSKDAEGIYLTIDEFHQLAKNLTDLDGLAELATDMHVMNIPVTADRIMQQINNWKHLEPTHVRLGPEYRDVV